MHRLPPLWHRSAQDVHEQVRFWPPREPDTLIYKNLQKRRLWGSFVDRQGNRPGPIESGGFPSQFRKKKMSFFRN